ncbi:GGDEF domain-containing protein [Tissierella pigra]|uniref:GGDEF domain-containing protein n=1 Tax=Tissierella pigra TaxID=2607614 RepID=A0A6N7XJI2_9FIRM|nr:GGDEF domain-containing protein [Tissierella pigra]MBU5424819.1 GGDEF domain-containing protein [Tissierella pigra]MSU02219.1 GGDEF domain-containing protein [Tissierella pigra]
MIIAIFRELFINACILVTVVFVGSQFFMNTGLGSSSTIKVKVQAGILGGILGIILMFFSIKIPPNGIMDLRHIAIIISAIHGSGIVTFITGMILALFRLLYKGISDVSIIAASIIIVVMSLCIFIRWINKNKFMRWIYMFISSGLIATIGFFLTIENSSDLINIIVAYWLGSLFAIISVYFLTEYLVQTYFLLKRLKEESTIDFLTGLSNTRNFDVLFNSVIKNSIIQDEKISILMLDIDFFKKVNDTYGHNAGDIVLKELGELLSKSIRTIDIVARIGGEEFCIILKDCSKDKTLEIAERIKNMVEEKDFLLPEGINLKVTISIGCAIYPDTTLDIEKIKELADIKLYEAKHTGRNRVCM